ncbi:iodothyronine deiodinase [Chlorella sorokiniana]|uniref:Iodothyronine deiodinase n=1 Tax=Chlorella sorokiniana TaxID=3076 RepID=A0A2P6TYG3_CHLSO|nr:iodothyronine deiodinase [Chlorella sorokiniana]|eukprot:PRW59105.1 iodothyronine deiodinase [Chlorella sorokiniana]
MDDLEAALASDDPEVLRAALKAAQAALRQARVADQQTCRVDEFVGAQQAVEAAAASRVGGGGSGSGGGSSNPPLMFSLEQLQAMLRREDELRLSAEVQEAYAAAELREDTDWMEVTEGLQRRVLREFGVPPHQEETALRHFRAAPHMHPELKPLAIYHRHQRSRQGPGLVGAFNSLFAELQDQADIRGVYITEAHAQDEWPITSARYTPDRKPVILNQPRTVEERFAAAAHFVQQFGFQPPMLVDPIDNPFDAAFAPWPLRFYILHRGRIAYKAQPRECSYSLAELRERLLQLLEEEEAADGAASVL